MRLAWVFALSTLCAGAADIPQGTHLLLRLVNSITTRTARTGDFVYFRTATPVIGGGGILVPADSYVQGVVTRSVRSGRVKGRAELAIRIDTLTLASGKTVRLNPTLTAVDAGEGSQQVIGKEGEVKEGGTKGADAVRIASTGGAGAAIGGLATQSWKGAGIGAGAGGAIGLATVLLTRGREVDLRQGSTVDVVFERPVPLD